jgi:hypothetical protein
VNYRKKIKFIELYMDPELTEAELEEFVSLCLYADSKNKFQLPFCSDCGVRLSTGAQ